jgi:uncharacterized membrane protein
MTFTILRAFHIVTASLWVGGTVMLHVVIVPAVRDAGPAGAVFMQQLARAGKLSHYLQQVSVVATVTGVVMYGIVSGGFDRIWIASGPGIGFTTGSIAALLAVVVGMAINSPTSLRLGRLMAEIQEAGGTPGPDHVLEIQRLQARLQLSGLLTISLMMIALVMMSVSRYLQ